jgi:hypothetical protein
MRLGRMGIPTSATILEQNSKKRNAGWSFFLPANELMASISHMTRKSQTRKLKPGSRMKNGQVAEDLDFSEGSS